MNLHPPRHMQAIKWNYMTNRKLKSIKIHKPKANSRPEVNKDHSEIEETERNPIKKSQQNTEVEISKHPTWSIIFLVRTLRKWNKWWESGMKKLCKISYRVPRSWRLANISPTVMESALLLKFLKTTRKYSKCAPTYDPIEYYEIKMCTFKRNLQIIEWTHGRNGIRKISR